MPPRSMRPDRVVLAQQKKEARPARLASQRRDIPRRARATAAPLSHASPLPRLVPPLLPRVRCQCSSCVGTCGWGRAQTDGQDPIVELITQVKIARLTRLLRSKPRSWSGKLGVWSGRLNELNRKPRHLREGAKDGQDQDQRHCACAGQ